MTTYRIADTAQDYKDVHALIKSEGFPDCPLSFPTIMAIRDGEVVGCLGTGIQNGLIVAGPLVIKTDQKRSFVIVRLVEHYVQTMRSCGVKSFIFYVELENKKYREFVDRVYKIEPYSIKGGKEWFVMEI